MLIVGDNLKYLVEQHQIVTDARCFDNNSLTLTLDRKIISIQPDDINNEIVYGHKIPPTWIIEDFIKDEGIVLPPQSAILGCSHEHIKMPIGYFGFVQTKGSLARLFMLINCCDGQIDAGYAGKVTFEICNLSTLSVRIHSHQPVAQLFIFKTSSRLVKPYNGRYQGAIGPTIQQPED